MCWPTTPKHSICVILRRKYMCNILFIISKKINSHDSSMNTPKQIMDGHVTFVCTDLLLTHTREWIINVLNVVTLCKVDRSSLHTRVRTCSRWCKIVLGFLSVQNATFGVFNSLICKWSTRERLNRSKEKCVYVVYLASRHLEFSHEASHWTKDSRPSCLHSEGLGY